MGRGVKGRIRGGAGAAPKLLQVARNGLQDRDLFILGRGASRAVGAGRARAGGADQGECGRDLRCWKARASTRAQGQLASKRNISRRAVRTNRPGVCQSA
jgi:hypothetical protein